MELNKYIEKEEREVPYSEGFGTYTVTYSTYVVEATYKGTSDYDLIAIKSPRPGQIDILNKFIKDLCNREIESSRLKERFEREQHRNFWEIRGFWNKLFSDTGYKGYVAVYDVSLYNEVLTLWNEYLKDFNEVRDALNCFAFNKESFYLQEDAESDTGYPTSELMIYSWINNKAEQHLMRQLRKLNPCNKNDVEIFLRRNSIGQ